MPERGRSFGTAAGAYERFRPGYPDELYDVVIRYAGAPIRTALEIGAGTGKATRLFARHGVEVTATEPDAAMLAELRRHVPAAVRTVRAGLEDIDASGTYDLVFAAASLHWTDAAVRWDRVSRLLRAGAVFASFGGPVQLADPEVEAAVRAARAPFLDSDDVPSPDGTPPELELQWPGTELERSDWFRDVRQVVVERRYTTTPAEYVGYLSTVSAYLQLPEEDRAEALRRINAVLPERTRLCADITLHLARRTSISPIG